MTQGRTTSPERLDARSRSLDLLEFPQVKERLAGLASLPEAKQAALGLQPSTNPLAIAQSQQETQEARQYVETYGLLDFGGVGDIETKVRRASLDGVLTGTDLWTIFKTLSACRALRGALASKKELPLLASLAASIADVRELERELGASVDQNGFVSEQASPDLRWLRSQAEESRVRLVTSLERTMRRLERSSIVQEPLITERNGRMVLLVKMEMRPRVPGIVHDVSDSGATAFVEPIHAVGLGNEWREATLAVQREEERVLRALSVKVGYYSADILESLRTAARLDLAMAKGRYSTALHGVSPVFVEGERGYIEVREARHPLLTGKVVPVDVSVGGENTVLLVTGPNAGGKTVSLKTLGLLAAMAQAGMHVPARQCNLTIFDAVYADIGDQQSIERSLSSFSSHIESLREIMEGATSASLVLLDELGTSTDPEEGAALAKAVLSYFANRGTACAATTHHRDVAAYVQEQPGMTNASVELDPNTLLPTYKLTLGLPGRSYALTIAARMGINDETVEHARSLLSEEHRHSEELLHELERERGIAEEHRRIAEEERVRLEAARRELEERLAALEAQKSAMLEETHARLLSQAEDLLKRLQRAERALAQPSMDKPSIKEETAEVAKARQEIKAMQRQAPPSPVADWKASLKPGDFVYVRGVPQPVEVASAPTESNTVEVMLGSIRARMPFHQVEKKANVSAPRLPEGVYFSRPVSRLTRTELDLHGMRYEEAEAKLEEFLDQAVLRGLSVVRVLHGHGTGALRAMVRERLKKHPLVKSSQPGEGNTSDGVTVVELN
ncbi:MAG: endonuclease MutS2 [SAR202 cluster bacterium]|nr:endonuclease MutS2 [SAR202 cluster bacterium]